jgi:DsbC/DsbD-like thiol-disulfide interchange protein
MTRTSDASTTRSRPTTTQSFLSVCAATLCAGVGVSSAVAQDHGTHIHPEPTADGRVPVSIARDVQAEDDRLVIPQFVVEHTSLLPGQRNEIGIWMQIDPDWHIYWTGQNDTGFPLTAEWDITNEKVSISDQWVWPKPSRYIAPGNILDHVYFAHTLVRIPVWVEPDAEGEVTIVATLDYLVCKDVCLFENAEIEITLPITADLTQRQQAATWSVFTRFEGEYPVVIRDHASDSRISVTQASGDEGDDPSAAADRATYADYIIRVPGAADIAFYPHESGLILADPLGEATARGDTLRLSISERQGTTEDGSPPPLRGIVEAWNEFGGSLLTAFIGAEEPELAPWLDVSKDASLEEGATPTATVTEAHDHNHDHSDSHDHTNAGDDDGKGG